MRHARWKTAKAGVEVSKVTGEPAEAAEKAGLAEATGRVVLVVEIARMGDLGAEKTILAGVVEAAAGIGIAGEKATMMGITAIAGNDKLIKRFFGAFFGYLKKAF